jgi:hypothetical protein
LGDLKRKAGNFTEKKYFCSGELKKRFSLIFLGVFRVRLVSDFRGKKGRFFRSGYFS